MLTEEAREAVNEGLVKLFNDAVTKSIACDFGTAKTSYKDLAFEFADKIDAVNNGQTGKIQQAVDNGLLSLFNDAVTRSNKYELCQAKTNYKNLALELADKILARAVPVSLEMSDELREAIKTVASPKPV